MKFWSLIIVVFMTLPAVAQINITEEATVSRLMDTYVMYNRSSDYVQGWKIQLVTTNDRRKMEATRSKFGSYYPNIVPAWKHVAPYYSVQVGAFRTKLELQGFLLQLKKDFPNAIPIRAKIRKSELLD